MMEGYLLFIILLFYAELSLCPTTRAIGRILFYTHTLALVTPLFATTANTGLIMSAMVYLLGLWIAEEVSTSRISKWIFILVGIVVVLNYYAIYNRFYIDILIGTLNIMENMDTIFRWGLLTAVGCCSNIIQDGSFEVKVRDAQITIGGILLLSIF